MAKINGWNCTIFITIFFIVNFLLVIIMLVKFHEKDQLIAKYQRESFDRKSKVFKLSDDRQECYLRNAQLEYEQEEERKLHLEFRKKCFSQLNSNLDPYKTENIDGLRTSTKNDSSTMSTDSTLYNSNNLPEHPWLIIGIPTIKRPKGKDYLIETLHSISLNLPADPADPFYKKILVVVMDHTVDQKNRPLLHEAFETAIQKYQNNPMFLFIKQSHTAPPSNPSPSSQGDEGSSQEKHDSKRYLAVSSRVQQQTMDVANLLLYSHKKSHYFLFMEDDFRLCPNGLKAFYHLLTKADLYSPNWACVRASFGLNGIFMKNNNNDLLSFAEYLKRHRNRRPPDHLLTEYCAVEKEESLKLVGKNRPFIGYRYNVFEHIGEVSTLRESKHWIFPGCYEELIEPVVFKVEAWNSKECPNDDIWPCHTISAQKQNRFPWVKWKNL